MLRVLSLGAGVQSTTMALMAAHGEFDTMPVCAVFADTGDEPAAVYDHLKWLMSPNVLPFPVHIVKAGNIREDVLRQVSRPEKVMGKDPDGKGRWAPPFYVRKPDGEMALLYRTCTGHYKIEPIDRFTLAMLGIKKGQRRPKELVVEKWIGISLDEVMRAKPSPYAWAKHRWPLLEKRMSRAQCLAWLERHGYPRPPKSACVMCPYRSNDGWLAMRQNQPAEFERACRVDEAVRDMWPATRDPVFLHRSLTPLREANLDPKDDGQLDMFNEECVGMCGV